jgi:hypothetical protein
MHRVVVVCSCHAAWRRIDEGLVKVPSACSTAFPWASLHGFLMLADTLGPGSVVSPRTCLRKVDRFQHRCVETARSYCQSHCQAHCSRQPMPPVTPRSQSRHGCRYAHCSAPGGAQLPARLGWHRESLDMPNWHPRAETE